MAIQESLSLKYYQWFFYSGSQMDGKILERSAEKLLEFRQRI